MIVDRMAPYVKKKKIISQISKFKLICKYESSFTCTCKHKVLVGM